jgi:hypothetical protein
LAAEASAAVSQALDARMEELARKDAEFEHKRLALARLTARSHLSSLQAITESEELQRTKKSHHHHRERAVTALEANVRDLPLQAQNGAGGEHQMMMRCLDERVPSIFAPGTESETEIYGCSGLSRTTSHGSSLQCMPQEAEITAEVFPVASPGSLHCDTVQILRSTLLTFLYCKCTRALTF